MDINAIKTRRQQWSDYKYSSECESDLWPLSISDTYFTIAAFTKLVLEGKEERCNCSVSKIPTAVSLTVKSRDSVTLPTYCHH